MGTDICKLTATGRVGRDAEVKSVGNNSVVEFSIANSQYVGQGKGYNGGAYDTAWFKCAVWMKDASDAHKIAGDIRKGAEVSASGDYTLEVWKDNDGKTQQAYKLKLSRGDFKVSRPGSGDTAPSGNAQRSNAPVRGSQAPRASEPDPFDNNAIPF